MGLWNCGNLRYRLALAAFLVIASLQLVPLMTYAKSRGTQPATGQAVQGQTAAQPEGTVLNLVNWVGNVISPVGAALAVVMAVISYSQGRGVARWAVTAAGLLVISGLTRLIEFWIQNGTAGGEEGRSLRSAQAKTLPQIIVGLFTLLFYMAGLAALCTMVLGGVAFVREYIYRTHH